MNVILESEAAGRTVPEYWYVARDIEGKRTIVELSRWEAEALVRELPEGIVLHFDGVCVMKSDYGIHAHWPATRHQDCFPTGEAFLEALWPSRATF